MAGTAFFFCFLAGFGMMVWMDLEQRLIEYAKGDHVPFHMPGHKRKASFCGFPVLFEYPPGSFDITEIEGFDDLHDQKGILKEETDRASAFYGTKATLFSVNGSTASNLAAVCAAVPKGGRILISSDAHRSILHAAELRELTVKAIETPELLPGVPSAVTPELLAEALDRFLCDAVVITSPTYEGDTADIEAIAGIVHAKGALLIVDEAHGAHFSMHPAFPKSAVRSSADLVIQSLHKTLPALTQTSLLHNVSGAVRTSELLRYLDIFETSSPSYVLLASITSCLHFLMKEEERIKAFTAFAGRLNAARAALSELPVLKLLTAPGLDPSKLTIYDPQPRDFGFGADLAKVLRERYDIWVERTGKSHVLAMASVCNTDDDLERLCGALNEYGQTLLYHRTERER